MGIKNPTKRIEIYFQTRQHQKSSSFDFTPVRIPFEKGENCHYFIENFRNKKNGYPSEYRKRLL